METIAVEPFGHLVVEATAAPDTEYPPLTVELDGHPLFDALLSRFRYWSCNEPTRMTWSFRLPALTDASELRVHVGDAQVVVDLPARRTEPAPYDLFFDTPAAHGRKGVYSTGRPDRDCSPELLSLALTLPQPILDYGCGTGALVRELREAGVMAFGLELDTPEMRKATDPSVAPYVSYVTPDKGSAFSDRSFGSVVCSEVLEHVGDYVQVARELERLASDSMLITVPDASAIPTLHQHAVVPWHLLEGSHVNFFSRLAVRGLFEPAFEVDDEYGLGRYLVNGTAYFTSLGMRLTRVADASDNLPGTAATRRQGPKRLMESLLRRRRR